MHSGRHFKLGLLLLTGLLSGLLVGQFGSALAAPAPSHGEHILIAVVDDLTADQSRLVSLWHISISANQVELSPLYPLPLGQTQSLYTQPHSPIVLAPKQLETAEYLIALSGQATWDAVFWLDLAAYAQLNSSLPALSATWEQPQAALRQQVEALNTLCQLAGGGLTGANLNTLLAQMPQHLRSTQSTFELITAWDEWVQQSEPFSCQHTWAG